MIILIPIGGIGQRFKNIGFSNPKALIKVNNKEIIYHLIDNLIINHTVSYIYIPYNKEYCDHNFEELIKNRYPAYKFKFLVLDNQTRGAAETIYVALSKLFTDNIRYPVSVVDMKKMFDKPVLCIDSDNFYKTDIIKMWNGENCVFTFDSKNTDAKFSYIITDENENIKEIMEKNKISDNACCGAYGFSSYYDLMDNCRYIIDNNITQKNEFYTSGVIDRMLQKTTFKNIIIENKNYFSLGTPQQVKQFEHTYLLDLDGTLVNTDNIYTEVWKKILKEYNLYCDKNFFDSFIKGKSDTDFLQYLIPSISKEKIKDISKYKDEYFTHFLELKNDILYDNVIAFFDNIQNSHIAIVTSCNKKAALNIINKYKLNKYISCVLAAEDVDKHKPHPKPYLKAASIMKTSINKCIIFEDSTSGYMAAKNSNPFKIYMYFNGNNHFVKKINNHFDNYNNIDTNTIIKDNKKENADSNLQKIFETLKYLPIKNISKKDDSNIKTGYICDINKYSLTFFDNENINIILKTSNNDNELSKVAKKLNMYDNEIYFYKNISNIINVNVPKYHGTFEFQRKKTIIMSDICKFNGNFNIDLNNNVTLLLKVVEDIFYMHNKFYFTDENSIIESMKSLKKVNEITYYKDLIYNRFELFINNNNKILSDNEKRILRHIFDEFENILNDASTFPLSFCHGDFKSPNIFYKNNTIPFFLDWQYIHLNKGISDIVFLLVESINFDKKISDLVLVFYYKLLKENKPNILFEDVKKDFINSLCIFPFFVMVWFNSENQDKLIDRVFPLKFMRNLLKYYNYYL